MKRIIALILSITLPVYAGILLSTYQLPPFPNLATVQLNGSTQYLSAPANAGMNPDYNTPFWVSFWVKTSQTGTTPTITSSLTSLGTGIYNYMQSDGKVVYALLNTNTFGVGAKTPIGVNDGNPHHIAFSYSGGGSYTSYSGWIDAVPQVLTSAYNNIGTHSTTSSATVTIGADLLGVLGAAEDFFAGYINQYAFKMNAQLSDADVTAIYNAGTQKSLARFAPGVWLWLAAVQGVTPLDSIATNGLIDRGTSGMNFSPVAMTSANIVQNLPTTYYGRESIHGNGSTTLFNAGTPAALQPEFTDSFSFHYWAYVDSAALLADISFMGNNPAGASGGWNVVANFSPAMRAQVELDALPYTGSEFFGIEGNAGDIPLRQWFDMGGSYNGSNSPNGLKLYINGALLPTTTYGAASLAGTIKGFPFTFMGQGTGLLQEVPGYGYNPTFWNSVLTAADFAALHANGPLIAPTALSSYASHCVSFWPIRNLNLGVTGATVPDIKGGNNATVTSALFSTFIPAQ